MAQHPSRLSVCARRCLARERRAARQAEVARAFIAAYLDCRNAAEAARRLGIAKKRAAIAGHRLLKKPAVVEALRAAGIEIDADRAALHPNRRGADGLNPRQRRFVAEYAVSCNAHDAALRAGYAPRSAATLGSRQLRDPAVIAALAKAGVTITYGMHPTDQQRKPRPPFVKQRLTARQQRFVAAYLELGNASEAARRAGLTTRHLGAAGSKMLHDPAVAAVIAAEQEKLMENGRLTAARVLQEYMRIAFANIRDIMDWGPDGVSLRPKDATTEDQSAAIGEFIVTADGSGTITARVTMQPKLEALNALARHLGIDGSKGVPLPAPPWPSAEERAALRERLLGPPPPAKDEKAKND